MLVHAVNPHGMANFRRFNENNVDLNRNAVPEESWDELLGRDPNAAGYEDFDGTVFNPRRVPTALDAYIYVWFRAAYGIAANGYVTLKRAMVAGQYHNPRGIFYGGEQLQASHRLLRDFLVQNGFTKTRGKVTWVDVHTGLGPSGVDTLLMGRDSEDPNIWFPDAPRPPQGFNSGGGGGGGGGDSDVSSGYDLTRGLTAELYGPLFRPDSSPMILTQEFGTVNSLLVARALILENAAHHYCPSGGARASWATLVRDAFYVRTDEWRGSVLRRGLEVLAQAAARSSS